MTETPASLLIVDSDAECARMLVAQAEARGYRARTAGDVAEATALLAVEPYDALLVDLAPGAGSVFELMAQLRRLPTDVEILVVSDRTSMAATIQWFDPEAFAFVRKSDIVQLFAAVARALERRRMTVQNRRLVWELQTINEIASGIARSLELDDVLTGAVQGLVRAMDAAGGSIRLRNEGTGLFEVAATVGPLRFRALWTGERPEIMRPSDQVIATGKVVVVEDFEALRLETHGPFPLRSAISVPLVAGDELLGALSLGATTPSRFQVADQRLLSTIGGQIVVAIQNARLHQSVREAKRQWEQTFDVMSDLIAVFNSRGELLRGNQALAQHLSLPVTALRGMSCRDLGFCAGGDACACGATPVPQTHGAGREVTFPDGQIFSVTTFPVSLVTRGAAVVQVAKNVTEEIRSARRLQSMTSELAMANTGLLAAMGKLQSTQSQLVQAEKLSAIGQLVAGVAHELNNPLTSVIGYAQLVDEELQDGSASRAPADIAADVRRIAEEAERAARIVRNLLAFARRQNTARALQNLADLCARVLSLRAYEFRLSGIALQTEFAEPLPQVFADDGLLQQMLLNLVLNAEQAMRTVPVRRLRVAAMYDEASGALELSMTDSGHGIEPGNLSRVFDPFFTTRDVGEGTGLGLSICYGIIRDHGGHVRVSSVPGEGTTFKVTLPARLSDPAVAETGVMVAHMDPGEREFMAAAFRGWGYRTIVAATVQEALDAYTGPGVQIAVVDRSIVSADVDAWRAARSSAPHRAAMILTCGAMDDALQERFGRDPGLPVLLAPVELRALHVAVQAGMKECV